MELRQLDYFRTVARTENMTEAASQLHISQPSLSMTISRLEADVGIHLFDRIGGRLHLNAMGRDFLRNVDRIFAELDEIRNQVEDRKGTAHRSVAFGVTTAGLCLPLLSAYLSCSEPIAFRQYHRNGDGLKAMLQHGEIDFAISNAPILAQEIQWTPLIDDEILALIPNRHPLAARNSVTPEDLLGERFVLNETEIAEEGEFTMLFRQQPVQPSIYYIGQESSVVMEMAKQGLGIALISKAVLHGIPRQDGQPSAPDPILSRLKPVRILAPNNHHTLGAAHVKGHYMSSPAQQFYEFTLDHLHRLAASISDWP